MAENDQDTDRQQENSPAIQTQKIYIKDISFETPNSPEIFTREWKPSIRLDLGHKFTELPDGLFEVVLSLTITVEIEGQTAYLAEVQQAGLFYLHGFDAERLHRILNVNCPHALYPYAAFVISDLVTRSGFPQLLLAPVNFNTLYNQRLAEAGEAAKPAAG
jgi:preprotein translocase subunit SecB